MITYLENKLYTLDEVQRIQSSGKIFSTDKIFKVNDENDLFERKFISISKIDHIPLSMQWYIDNGKKNEAKFLKHLMDLIQLGKKIIPIVITERFQIMDGIHRYMAYKELKHRKIEVFQRVRGQFG